jgi:hypothetical protein
MYQVQILALHLLISSECKITLKLRKVIHVGLCKFKYGLCMRKWIAWLMLGSIIFRHVAQCAPVEIYVKEECAISFFYENGCSTFFETMIIFYNTIPHHKSESFLNSFL